MSQRSFASAEYALKKKRTRREQFLAEMERIVPWSRLEAAIAPSYPSSGRVGRPPIGLPRMLRMYCLQQWNGLADEALEDALYDSQSMRDFVGIDLSRESVPDATTLLKFRRLLLANDLTKTLFDEINAHLAEQGLLMRAGTIVDATIIAAPSSTKNAKPVPPPQGSLQGDGQEPGPTDHVVRAGQSGDRQTIVDGPPDPWCVLIGRSGPKGAESECPRPGRGPDFAFAQRAPDCR